MNPSESHQNWGYWLETGKQLFGQKKFEDALTHFDAALAHGAPAREIFFEKGKVYKETGNFAAAIGMFEQALVLGLRDCGIEKELGETYWRQQWYGHAAQWFKKALGETPGDAWLLQRIESCRAECGGEKRPAEIGGERRSVPCTCEMLAPLARSLADGNYSQAQARLAELSADADDTVRQYLDIAGAYLSLTKYRKAADALETLMSALGGAEKRHAYIENIRQKRGEVFKTAHCCSKPTFLQIFLTHRCNLNCIMCLRVREKIDTLPENALAKLQPFFPFTDIISWQGGEVFLVDYFKNALAAIGASHPHIEHNITTNGLLISGDWACLLSDIDAHMRFSIDAPVKAVYERIRTGGSFDRLVKNLETINNAYNRRRNRPGKNFSLNVVVMKSNVHELAGFPAFCSKFGIGDVSFSYLFANLIPEEDIFSARNEKTAAYLRDSLPAIEAEFRERHIQFECSFAHLLASGNGGPQGTKDGAPGHAVRNDLRCVFPWTGLQIGADGVIKPSCDCVVTAGNMLQNPIEEIWNNEVMTAYRQKLMNGTYHGLCAKQCMAGLTDVKPLKFNYL